MKSKLMLIGIVIFFASCNNWGNDSTDAVETQRQEQLQKESQAEAGLPAIHNFQEKKLLKQIYELRDNEKLITYAYLWNEFNGKMVFIGKCIGYGIPYSTQYSNPQKVITFGNNSGYYAGAEPATIAQAEPNGLFMPSSASGTWLMMLDSAGTPHPVYIEPNVIVSPFKLNI
jgi:hypothetical protein